MAEYIFGAGTVVGVRTDVTGATPAFLGTLQDVTLDFSRKIESLVGQYASPVAFGGGELTISGKAKMGRFSAAAFNNTFLGGAQVANSGIEMSVAEAITPSTTTFLVANHSTFLTDLGLFYAGGANAGIQLTPVSGAPAVGQYNAGVAGAGQYTINAADENIAMLVFYSYSVSTENQITLNNALMGPVPSFQLFIKQSFTYFGVAKSLSIKLNYCVSEKLALAFTNNKFSIPELDITAGADATNTIGTISMTE